MIGIGLYELSGWTLPMRNLNASDSSSSEEADNENLSDEALDGNTAYQSVFYVFLTTVSLCLIYWHGILKTVHTESMDKDKDFGASQYGKGENVRLTELRRELRGVQRKFRLNPPDVPDSDDPDVVTVLKELSRDLRDRDERWRQIFAHTLRQPPKQLRRTMSV